MISMERKDPNWLLYGLIVLSLCIHLLVFLYISDIYRPRVLKIIEFSLKESPISKSRSIPSPPLRDKKTFVLDEIKTVEVKKIMIPNIRPPEIDPLAFNSNTIAMNPSIKPSLDIKIWDFPPHLSKPKSSDYINRLDYLSIVRAKIEEHKKYPESARRKEIEGKTTVSFTIDSNGYVSDLKVVKSSKYKDLDKAAIDAIKSASPFPKPPKKLFKGPISLEITLVFKLI